MSVPNIFTSSPGKQPKNYHEGIYSQPIYFSKINVIALGIFPGSKDVNNSCIFAS